MHALAVSILFSVAVACVVATSPLSAHPKFQLNLHVQHAKRALQDDQCYKIACESGSGMCGISSDTQTLCLGDQRYCQLASNSLAGTCAKEKDNGATCEESDECVSGHCSSGVCKDDDDRGNGESCTEDSQCESDKCASGVCQAISNGDACNYSDQCSPADYCPSGISRVCTTRGTTGQACSGESCFGVLVCGASGVCTMPFTTPSGHACADDSECVEGTACVSYNGTMMCATVPASSLTGCSSSSDCTRMGESCQCNGRTGTQQCMQNNFNAPKGLNSAAQDINTCLVNNCKGNTNIESCIEGVCKKQGCNYRKVYTSGILSLASNVYPKCYADYIMKMSECGSASTVTFSVGAMIVAVLAHLL